MVEFEKEVELGLPILGKPGSKFRLESDNPRFAFDQNGYDFPVKIDCLTKVTVNTNNPRKEEVITTNKTIIPQDDPEKGQLPDLIAN